MEYNIFITDCILGCLKSYFEISPFKMKAAFAVVEINEGYDCSTILLSDFYKLAESDYEMHASDCLCFYSKKLLSILKKQTFRDVKSFVYIHSHNSANHAEFENEDHEMIFRISHAYIPFGVHASLYYTNGELSGKVWMPSLTTQPLKIIYE